VTEELLGSIELSEREDEAGYVDLPPRSYPLAVGDEIKIEFGFGAFADEIVCDGVVIAVAEVSGGRRIRVEVEAAHGSRLEYVHDVLTKKRPPVVRRHPRVGYRAPVDIEVEGVSMRTHTGNISCGGAFIVCDTPPPIGTELRVALEVTDKAEIRTKARVTWVGLVSEELGFGVQFSLDRHALDHVREIVRAHVE
jgi:hypothetical protein